MKRAAVGFSLGRATLALTILGGLSFLLLASDSGVVSFTPLVLYWFCAATFLSSGLATWFLARGQHVAPITGIQLGLDLFGIATLVYVTGGARSAFAFLYGVVIVAAGIILGRRAALAFTLAGLVLHACQATLLASGLLPPPFDQAPAIYLHTPVELISTLLPVLAALTAVGVLTVILVRRFDDMRDRLAASQREASLAARRRDDVIRSLQSGLVTTSSEGIIDNANLSAQSIFQGSLDTILGRAITDFIPGTPARDSDSSLIRQETSGVRSSGVPFPVGFTQTPLVNEQGLHTGWLFIFQDITEKLALKAEFERANRLATLGHVAAGLAHEIRNPLGAVRSSVEVLVEGGLDPQDTAKLGTIVQREIHRINDLVTSMLELAKPRDPDIRAVDLAELAREELGMLGLQYTDVSFVLSTPASDAPVVAWADADQLRQCLHNLLRNAVEAKSSGPITVTVGTSCPSIVSLDVHNEGKPIPPAVKDHLFDLYFSTKSQGIGIGLALVKGFVERQQGSVTVHSTARDGTTFRIDLPRASAQRVTPDGCGFLSGGRPQESPMAHPDRLDHLDRSASDESDVCR